MLIAVGLVLGAGPLSRHSEETKFQLPIIGSSHCVDALLILPGFQHPKPGCSTIGTPSLLHLGL